MATILTLIILGMIFQALVAILDSILETVKVKDQLEGIPILGAQLNLIWAYVFVAVSQINADDGLTHGVQLFGSNVETFALGRFGMDVAMAIAIVAFIPIREAAVEALRKGIGGNRD